MKKVTILRYLGRASLIMLSALCALGLLNGRLDGVLPALSPFTGATTAVGSRALSFFLLFSLPVLILVVFRKRWFCRNACPVGLILELVGKARNQDVLDKHRSFPKIGGWLFFIAVGGAFAGYPLFVWMDPLALMSSFSNAFRTGFATISIMPLAGLVVLVAVSIWRPNLWCGRICPLGASQEFLKQVAAGGSIKEQKAGRRMFLGLLAGGMCGGAARKLIGKTDIIRPPGALPENRFTAMCSRCGTCVAVCPEGIINQTAGKSGLAGLMTPEVTIGEKNYCSELCNNCGKTCPTGAIGRSSMEAKRNISMGVAQVIKPLCLSWEKKEFCMLCSDFCPYDAVRSVDSNGVKCPEVIEDKCRGCGACQVVCPTTKLSIVVKGGPQKRLKPVKLKVVRDIIELR